MRKEAISLLESQEAHDDKSLLAMLMLGQTASWHNPNDLGISYFNTLRNHLNALTSGINSGSLLTNRNNYQFFEEALIYWEMLLSDIAQAQEAIREAQELEARLLSLAHPAETEVVNPGDDETPV
ncbi:hypothetical protein F66182_16637, partial [Fusarium sp. NRRL 66182]